MITINLTDIYFCLCKLSSTAATFGLLDMVALILIIILAITFIIVMLALAWALFEDTEIGQMITERFKERWEDDA